MAVTPEGYAWMTHGLRQIQSKVAVVLEGGYNLESLQVSAEAVVETLTKPMDEKRFQDLAKDAIKSPREAFKNTKKQLKELLKD